MKFLEEKFVPIAARIGNERHLVAIRDAFVLIMPITIAGALAVLFLNIQGIFAENGLNVPAIEQGYTQFLEVSGLKQVLNVINRGSLNMIAVLLVVALGYTMTQQREADAPAGAIVALATYLGLTPAMTTLPEGVSDLASVAADATLGAEAVGTAYLASTGLFVGMVVALITAEVFSFLAKNKHLVISMPDGVPPAVSKAFSSLIPAILTMLLIGAAGSYILIFTHQNIWTLINQFVSAPLTHIADSVGTVALVNFMVGFLWIFGLHGANIVGAVTSPILKPLSLENVATYATGQTPPHIYTEEFGIAYVNLGGSGATIGLVLAIFLFSKSKASRTVASLAAAPAIFEINEPLTFGLPIVMNPVFAIPFVVGPVVLGVVSYFLAAAGIVGKTCIIAPWVTPPVLGAFLITGGDIRAAIWNVVEIVLLTVMWAPFVMMSDRMSGQEQ